MNIFNELMSTKNNTCAIILDITLDQSPSLTALYLKIDFLERIMQIKPLEVQTFVSHTQKSLDNTDANAECNDFLLTLLPTRMNCSWRELVILRRIIYSLIYEK